MEESVFKSEQKQIRIKKRQLTTKLKSFQEQDAALLDSTSFDSQLASMESACFEVTNLIDELIINMEDEDEDDKRISGLEETKKQVLKMLRDSKHEMISSRSGRVLPTQNQKDEKEEEEEEEDKTDGSEVSQFGQHTPPVFDNKPTEQEKRHHKAKTIGQKVAKKAVKKAMIKEELATGAGEGLNELLTEEPAEVVLELVLGSIGEQLGVGGTSGFITAALTHYAISQFAVLIGLVTSPIKMDFSGITQAKILKKLEDLNKKVDKIMSAPRKNALQYLKDGLLELSQNPINFKEAHSKFKEVQRYAKEAISMNEEDFTNFAVCTKYLLFAETMVQTFTESYKDGKDGFLPIERLTEARKKRLLAYLVSQVKDLKAKAETKGKKKEDHGNKVDDILKLVYSIISVCKNLTNPNTPINRTITFGIDTDYVPFGEEDATALHVGRDTGENQKPTRETMKSTPAYIVYIWRTDTMLSVRRLLKVYEIPLRQVSGNEVWIKLEEKDKKDKDKKTLICNFGGLKEKDHFQRTAEPKTGYPANIQTMKKLFETAKVAKDMDGLPKHIYGQMQKISEVYLSDLGIDINQKDDKGKTLLHYVACLKPVWQASRTKIDFIDCLVDSGADLAVQDSDGRTSLMAAIMLRNPVEENVKTLIYHSKRTTALNIEDNEGNNILHLAAMIKESSFTKEIVKILLKEKADATHQNEEDFNPRDMAHHNQNWKVMKILDEWLDGR